MATSGHSLSYPAPVRSREPNHFATEISGPPVLDDLGMIGRGAAMQLLRLQVRRIGPHFRAMLVSGEPGTGKELTARALHGISRGTSGPFISCDASTLESTTIGSDSSAYGGGATLDRIGWLMHEARQGTLFLDGIGEMPMETQAHLLRVLRRYGWAQDESASRHEIGTRIIASTEQDLRTLASTGRFRVELYRKICMVSIAVPSLKDRMEDLEELATHFLNRFAREHGKGVEVISEAAMTRLKSHRWPGNVRELENVVRCGVLQSQSATIEAHHLLSLKNSEIDTDTAFGGTVRLQDVVERHVLHVLRSCNGNKLKAAEVLGISRSTLYRMLDGSSVAAGTGSTL